MVLDRLERFRRGVQMYRDWCRGDITHPYGEANTLDTSGLESFRDKLRQQWDYLEGYVTAFSQGRYCIHVDARGLEDIYVQAFSGECREWHLEAILRDLELMLAELQTWPLHQPMTLHDPRPFRQGGKSKPESHAHSSFGFLGHLGHTSISNSSLTLHSIFQKVARRLDQRIEPPEEQEKLRNHLQALVEHPDMADLLPLPPSRIL